MMQSLLLAAAVRTAALAPAARRPEPSRLENTQNYRDATAASARFNNELQAKEPKKVAIIGGGLSGLSCADPAHFPANSGTLELTGLADDQAVV